MVNLIINFLASVETVADITRSFPDQLALLITAFVGGVMSKAAAIMSTGVTETEFEYPENAPIVSISLARTHLFPTPDSTFIGFDDPFATPAYPVPGSVVELETTSSIDISLKSGDVCAV